jgi:hypothetical protein
LLCLSLYVLGLVVWGLGCPALAEMSMVRAWHQVDDTTFSEMVTSQDQVCECMSTCVCVRERVCM